MCCTANPCDALLHCETGAKLNHRATINVFTMAKFYPDAVTWLSSWFLLPTCYILWQGEVEAEGTFEDVSSSSLFDELLEEDEEEEAGRPALQRQRTMSVQVCEKK